MFLECPEEFEEPGHYAAKIIARLLDIREQRLQALARDGVIPKAKWGKYALAPAVHGYIKYLRDTGSDGEDAQTNPEKLEPFKRRAHYQAELDKIRLQRDRGELVTATEVERCYAEVFGLLGQALETLPDILERDAAATPAQLVVIEATIDKVREQLYQRLIGDAKPKATVHELRPGT